MSALAEILAGAKSLSRADKLQLIQELVKELARDKECLIDGDRPFAVWSPDHAFEAADVVLRALPDESRRARIGTNSR